VTTLLCLPWRWLHQNHHPLVPTVVQMLHLLTLLNLAWISKQKRGQVSGSTLNVQCQKPHNSLSPSVEVITPEIVLPTSGEEHVPLPLEANIPKECLPEVLDVYDKNGSTLLRITIPYYYNVHDRNSILIIPAGDPPRMAQYYNYQKFLARYPVKFVRKYPGHIPTTPKGEGMFISASQSSPLIQQRGGLR
jgi:hypothetical protein